MVRDLFVKEMESQLVKAAIDHITPIIKETARAVIADMKPQVKSFVDEMKRQHVYAIEVVMQEKT